MAGEGGVPPRSWLLAAPATGVAQPKGRAAQDSPGAGAVEELLSSP